MAIEKLSATKITRLNENGMYGDGGNLWLQVTNNGINKSWKFRWTDRIIGKEHKLGLGSLDTVDLDKAREYAARYRLMLHEGQDPRQKRDASKLEAQIAAGLMKTVEQVADEYYEARYIGKSDKRRKISRLHLNNYIIATIGKWPIQKVDTNVILEQLGLRELWLQKNPTAGEVQGHLDRMFNYAIHKKYYSGQNPASRDILQHLLAPSTDVYQTKHHKSLPYKDAGRFFRAIRADFDVRHQPGYRTMSSFALEFVGLTGVRVGEVTQACWREFDEDTMIWTVPSEHKKNKKKSREVPITRAMNKILDQLRQRRREASRRREAVEASISPKDLVFPGYHKGTKMDDSTVLRVIDRTWKEDIEITTHGFRSTLRDWCRANRFPDVWWEIQVDHKLGDKTSQSYGPDQLTEKRRGMMELWGEYCSGPAPEPKTGKVVNLTSKRRSA
jgi:integrase